MEIPTEADWQFHPDDLDAACAYKNFHGKSFDEAVRMFGDNTLSHQEDLMYMPAGVFGFYLKAYIAYFLSNPTEVGPDAPSGFVSLIRFKAEHDSEMIRPLWSEIEPVLEYLAGHQDEFDANWEVYGCFRSEIHEMADFGFETTFDSSAPEIVPDSVTLSEMAYSNKTVRWPVALQIFHHSGIDQLNAGSRKEDILRTFGKPDAIGGGDHPQFGLIPEWVRYHRPLGTLRFEFEGTAITSVTFMPPMGSSGIPPEIEAFLDPQVRNRLSWFLAPLPPPLETERD
ncbi:hypothetical protein P12x_004263 [Tundrisphaera lichenicola]|uniref:hypothetical protein n=1 Tax=Tundrisphaera lichenicola TaxID=2029860 RepID=UPI003EBB9083